MISSLAASVFIVGLGIKIRISRLQIGIWLLFTLILEQFVTNMALHVLVSMFIASPFLIKMENKALARQIYVLCVLVPSLTLIPRII
ncbi:hypothetical protein TW78_10695 [Vibrio coralliilyticus]|jgi:hypothetical protein|uniref:Uncharacterized protein n=1 Tax=Vibrio coralliilyticus TaxID=190893 RepID=A0A837G667_9VIBR|nr:MULTISPECIES: hypothetical protein [Vibrio]AIS56970.1 hypothetical protein JV59_18140 [Vibrio coralliilyticus]AXN33242.1 hypothetical protein DVV14_18465 [Vibrio coralliilyticus]ERB67121.1 hypothetical protein N779_01300 [Vibrio coralliilyticus OCN008]KJY73042.1 hypothetical protein TW78_10695 [Vibrio coralliilyticus]KPH23640.1 hypothetical protein ADU60_19645 [Vibrio coralliilyticus]